jgi:DNA-binding MarR family transcriptional regulator
MSSETLPILSSREQLGWLIKRAQYRHHRALDLKLAELGVSLVQWNALREIDRNPGCSQHQLAELTFNSDQAFGTLGTRLKARGLVERTQGNGRATVHHLTPKGKDLLRRGQEVLSAVLAESFAPLEPKEQVELGRLLTKVLDAKLVSAA